MEGESPANHEDPPELVDATRVNHPPYALKDQPHKIGARISEYFRTHPDPNPSPSERATANDLRELLRPTKRPETTLLRTAPVENADFDQIYEPREEPSTSSGPPTTDGRVEELEIDESQEEPPTQEVQAPTAPGEPTRESGPGPITPAAPAEGGGQARPSAADFMIEVVETPLMITENGERQAWSSTDMSTGRDKPEVTD